MCNTKNLQAQQIGPGVLCYIFFAPWQRNRKSENTTPSRRAARKKASAGWPIIAPSVFENRDSAPERNSVIAAPYNLRVQGDSLHPLFGLTLCGALDALEYRDTEADDTCGQEQCEQGVSGHKLKDIADESSERAGGGQNGIHTRFNDFLKNPSFLIDLWLRVHESNVAFEVQSLACRPCTNPRYVNTHCVVQIVIASHWATNWSYLGLRRVLRSFNARLKPSSP